MGNGNEVQEELTYNRSNPSAKEKKGSASKLAIFASLSSIMALILALIAMYTAKNNTQIQETQFNPLRNSVVEFQAEQKSRYSSLVQTQENLQKEVQALNKNLAATLQEQQYQQNDWLLFRARYYLELAQINAHWIGSQEVVIALLQLADRSLEDFAEQKVSAIRQAIAQEVGQWKSLPQVDLIGLLSQLDAAQISIISLPTKQPYQGLATKNIQNKASNSNSTWRERLKKSLAAFEKLIVVRRTDSDITPLISPLHQALIRDSIRFHLQEAEWAILQNNPAVYQLALTQSVNEIKQTFDEKAADTTALLKQLETLQQAKLVTTRPPIEESLSLLNQWIEAKKSEGNKSK